ncbi:MAG: TolB family protein, partial [Miltoncostaeaceae bacterium]
MTRIRSLRLAALGTTAALAALALPATAAQGDLDLISVSGAGTAADALSTESDISPSGDRVAFRSAATNLSTDDAPGVFDIFLRRAATGDTVFVSRADGPAGAGGDAHSYDPSVSADARYVAFESNADNLSSDDDDTVRNIYVRDTVAETTVLVTRANGANGAGADDDSYDPSISADGRYVAFESKADNLSPIDDNTVRNIFVRDIATNETFLISRESGVAGSGSDGTSYDPSISADGRYVAFRSNGDNLAPDDDNGVVNLFVRDRLAKTTILAGRATGPAGVGVNAGVYRPAISGDGTRVAFDTTATNLGHGGNGQRHVYVRNLLTGTTELVSAAPDGSLGDEDSDYAELDHDGSRIAFRSRADNLAGGGVATWDIFARDLPGGPVSLVSRAAGPAGAPADSNSYGPTVSADGRHAAFRSGGDNLSSIDDNGHDNIFRRDLDGDPAPPAPPAPQATPPAAAPQQAPKASRRYRCAGRVATIVGTNKRD